MQSQSGPAFISAGVFNSQKAALQIEDGDSKIADPDAKPVCAMDRETLISSLARWRVEHGVSDPQRYIRNRSTRHRPLPGKVQRPIPTRTGVYCLRRDMIGSADVAARFPATCSSTGLLTPRAGRQGLSRQLWPATGPSGALPGRISYPWGPAAAARCRTASVPVEPLNAGISKHHCCRRNSERVDSHRGRNGAMDFEPRKSSSPGSMFGACVQGGAVAISLRARHEVNQRSIIPANSDSRILRRRPLIQSIRGQFVPRCR